MEGRVSSAEPLASFLGIRSAVRGKTNRPGWWQMKITGGTAAVSVQRHSFAEIFGDGRFARSSFLSVCLPQK